MRLYFLTFLLFCSNVAASQTLAQLEQQLDSLLRKQQRSEVLIGLGFGNSPAYGSKVTNYEIPIVLKPSLSPSVSYYHKSGFYGNVSSYYLMNSVGKPWFEWDFTAGYDYTKNRNILTGISYTHYIYTDSSDVPTTPIKNELYAYFYIGKWWLQPGISLDYGWGKQVSRYNHLTERLKGNDFNMIYSVRHPFTFYNILKPGDGAILTPATNLTFGTATYYSNLEAFQYMIRVADPPMQQHMFNKEFSFEDRTKFDARAIDFTFNLSYFVGPVTINPSYTLFKAFTGSNQSVMSYFTARVYYSF
jgi:hypothetical protein